ncbi:hypothetical protein BDP27DRAFT_199519 [Rhodocollybia butyracea]|uniref:Hydrophobin n=1 Tax=Rhodocollybia butyracea TaxID=206335 RepID=A0A9P5PIN6_9AGAR|nr:hypothetical protein BDP27DRAFT_199519 [Rhodocollybia butyracea]
MQFKLAFFTAALATIALATPTPRNEPASSCSTGPVQCCQSVQTAAQAATIPGIDVLLGLLGVVIGDVTGLVVLLAPALTLLAEAPGHSAQAVCCTNNSVGGLISIGCAPVTL